MKELEKFRGKIRQDIRITTGFFEDRTGQLKEPAMGYSKVVTQGGVHVLYHMLYKAFGPRMVLERDRDNFQRLMQEYSYSYVKGGQPRQGIIGHFGPEGRLSGGNYMVTGAVVYYHADRYSGGGGVNVDGIGAHFKKVYARVGIELRLVDMSTSEICWSTMVESWVSGTKIGIDVFRFVTAWGDDYIISAEAGIAQYLPADIAFQVCMATAVVDMIEENQEIFIAKTTVGKKKADNAEPAAQQPAVQQKEEQKPARNVKVVKPPETVSEEKGAKQGAAKETRVQQPESITEEKQLNESVPFWKRPSYRSPAPGH
jgi:curli biogenesis system outer membrane secretion channel CsgG